MSTAIMWFRQDLRCTDNTALAQACNQHQTVIPLYILDNQAPRPMGSAQKWWLHHSLLSLQQNLLNYGLKLRLIKGNALNNLSQLIDQQPISAVYWNRCYEPDSIARDQTIKAALKLRGIIVKSFNGSLLNEPWTMQTQAGNYFKVFTPYWKQALKQLVIPDAISLTQSLPPMTEDGECLDDWNLLPKKPDWAYEFPRYWQPGEAGAMEKLEDFIRGRLQGYQSARNEPAKESTSRLSPHLHFGEISPWQIWRAIEQAKQDPAVDHLSADHFLSELGWREFSYHLLYHFPALPETPFRPAFNAFPWQNDAQALSRWQKGITGYPIIDAGMRELWQTGYMHNRVRMIVASFLTKDLLIDWRQGEAWFWDTLLDADLANNAASWQWVAGSGADAAPYFRVFNPVVQGEKFDPEGEYVRRWVPELAKVPKPWLHKPWEAPANALGIKLGQEYPYPVVDHAKARAKALEIYQSLKNGC